MEHQGRLCVFVVGPRAQLIKVAPVVVACEEAGQPVRLLMTGQHKETMADLIEEFGIRAPPETIMEVSERATVLSLLGWTPRALYALSRRLRALAREEGAPKVVVHGDTLSTLLGALAARVAGGEVFHLESGLSSGRLFDPFPEELTRRLVFRLADVALCPGPESSDYMRRHHRRCETIDTGGNTIEDAVMLATRSTQADAGDSARYLVVSLHRFQNIFDAARLQYLVHAVTELSRDFVVHFVLHPATRKRLAASGSLASLEKVPNLRLSPRLGYGKFLRLASGADCVLTDGGSNQEELATLGVPTLIMRQHTERSDGLGSNAVMEAELPGGVVAFVRSGGYRDLRREPRVLAEFGPSKKVADRLDQATRDGQSSARR
jgi:UDP-N-acetylglucosamine 2-epimerase (non-hydrolysing)